MQLPKPNFKGFIIAIALGVVVATALYQAQVRGWIPKGSLSKIETLDDAPADKAGVETGDIVTKINGSSIDSEN